MILKVCEEQYLLMIANKVRDISIKRKAEDYLGRIEPFAVALDKVQSDSFKLSEVFEVWKALEREMVSLQQFFVTQKVQQRCKQALTTIP